jgi:acyl carrier protein
MKKNLKEIINEIQKENGVKLSITLNDNDDLINDIGLDSLDLAQLTVMIEDIYGIDVFENKIVRKVYEIKELISE